MTCVIDPNESAQKRTDRIGIINKLKNLHVFTEEELTFFANHSNFVAFCKSFE